MLPEITRKRIKKRGTIKDHSNPAQFLIRVKEQSNDAIRDLTLIAENLDEKQLEKIFTAKKLAPLILAILEPKNKRTIDITEMLANRVFQKLIGDLPPELVNEFGPEIARTWTYAKVAQAQWKKPRTGKK